MNRSLFDTSAFDKETGILTTAIRPLNLLELQKQCEDEMLSFRIKTNIHLDLKWDAPLLQRAAIGKHRFQVPGIFPNKTFQEQLLLMSRAWEFPSPSALIQAGLVYHELTGEYILGDAWSRTSAKITLTFGDDTKDCHARVGLVAGGHKGKRHYYVDFLYGDNERSKTTNVVQMQKKIH